MLNLDKSYLKVWKVEDKGNYVIATTSSSRKDKRNDTWINSNWNVRFVGKCLENARTLKEGDKVITISGTVENVWDKEKSKNWTNVTVFEMEIEGGSNNADVKYEDADDASELPF